MVAELVGEMQDEQDEAEQGTEESGRARYSLSSSLSAHDWIHISASKLLRTGEGDRIGAPDEINSLVIYREGSERRPWGSWMVILQ